jgi:hypothetical protein
MGTLEGIAYGEDRTDVDASIRVIMHADLAALSRRSSRNSCRALFPATASTRGASLTATLPSVVRL